MAVDHERVLRALLLAVDRAGAGRLAAPERPDGHAVDDHRVGVQLARLASGRSNSAWRRSQIPASSHARSRRWAVLPEQPVPPGRLRAGPGGQDEPDHPDDDPVADPGPAALGADGLLGRQMVGDRLEEFLGHVGIGHAVVSLVVVVDDTPWRKWHANGFCQTFKISPETVRQILRNHRLKPWRQKRGCRPK